MKIESVDCWSSVSFHVPKEPIASTRRCHGVRTATLYIFPDPSVWCDLHSTGCRLGKTRRSR